MSSIHPRLAELLERHFGGVDAVTPEWRDFVQDVDRLLHEPQKAGPAPTVAENDPESVDSPLRTAVNAAPIILYQFDRDGRFVTQEGGALVGLGTSPGAWNGLLATEIHRDNPAAMACLKRALAGEQFVCTVTFPSGATYEASHVPLRDASGAYQGTVGILIDVTERERALAMLSESEDLLRRSQSVAAIGSYYFEVATGTWTCSPQLLVVLGIDDTGLKDVTGWLSAIHPVERDAMLVYLRDYVIGGRHPFDREYRIIRPADGRERWVHGLGRLEIDDQGRVTRMIGTIQDVTERRLTEQALWIKNWAVESSLSGIVLTGLDTSLTYVNPSFLRLWGYDAPQEVLGRPASSFVDHASSIDVLVSALQNGGSWTGEVNARRRDGTPFVAELVALLVRNVEGTPVAFMGSMIDVTERRRQQQALIEVKEQLSATLNALPDLLFSIDRAGVIRDYRAPQLAWPSAPPDQFLNRSIADVLPPDAARIILAAVAQAFETGTCPPTTYPLRRDNALEWFELNGARQGPAESPDSRVIVLVRDITARKRTEEELQRSQARLAEVVAVAHIGVFELDAHTGDLYWSPEQRRIFGWSDDETPSIEKYLACVHPDDVGRVRDAMRHANNPAGSGRYHMVERIVRRDGSVRWVETHAQTFFEGSPPDRRMARVSGAVLDITELRRVEDALVESEERLRLALTAANQGLFDLDVQTGEAIVSAEYALMLGYDPETFRESSQAWAERLHPDDRRIVYQVYSDYIAGRIPEYRVEFRQRTADGTWKWILSLARTVSFDAQGRPRRMLGTHTDITHRKEAEALLVQARDELESRVLDRTRQLSEVNARLEQAKVAAEAASEAKSRFLAMMSHEIRTPLNGVTSVLHLLGREPLSPNQLRWIQLASTSAETLLRVINDILDFSRVEAGRLELRLAPARLHEAIQHCVRPLAQQAAHKGLAWNIDIDPGLPPVVSTDVGRLGQVLGNLIGNAIKFTDAGSVALRVTVLSGDGRIAPVRFEIKDTGEGITPEQRGLLFRPFSQLDNSSTRRHGGTGLGLGICKHLVELLGGRIGVESEPRRGSTFWFEIPFPRLHDSTDAPQPGHDPSAAAATEENPAGSSSRSRRVLIAEDNEINQELAMAMVSAAGYAADCVADGSQAVKAALSGQYHLLLLDCFMPGVDGLTAARTIRAEEAHRAAAGQPVSRLPIVAMTANVLEGDREACLAAGMDDYIPKPLDPKEVLAACHRWLAKADEPNVPDDSPTS